jgi:RNA polymerase sigma-54 factor
MRLDTSQHMRMDQRMKLAPRMIQSMEILQLSTMALEERIDQELVSNPVLERADSMEAESDSPPVAGMPTEATQATASIDKPSSTPNSNDSWDDVNRSTPSRVNRSSDDRDPKAEAIANTAARSMSLSEALLQQWVLVDVPDRILEAGKVLIEWVDDDGYIRDSLDSICRHLPDGIRRDDVQAAWPILQKRLEPPGICARNIRESLLLQLEAIAHEQELDLSVPQTIVRDYLEDLEMNRLPQISRKSGLTLEQINEARQFMARHLNPRPGRLLVDAKVPSVTPDAVIDVDEQTGEYRIRLTDDRLPRLCVNEVYTRMARVKTVDNNTRQFINNNIRNARWLIEAIEQRRHTLLRVLRVVVDMQREFIEMGPEHLKPLPMTSVADQLGIHVATVSRAVADKYVQTPRGIFPLRQFFTGGMENAAGEAVSWDAVKAKLIEVIAQEDKKNPLSDDEIVEELAKRGLALARRTVAKYRKLCNIPPARRRREF